MEESGSGSGIDEPRSRGTSMLQPTPPTGPSWRWTFFWGSRGLQPLSKSWPRTDRLAATAVGPSSPPSRSPELRVGLKLGQPHGGSRRSCTCGESCSLHLSRRPETCPVPPAGSGMDVCKALTVFGAQAAAVISGGGWKDSPDRAAAHPIAGVSSSASSGRPRAHRLAAAMKPVAGSGCSVCQSLAAGGIALLTSQAGASDWT